jgi:lipopolysaccharide/colanic/teichoic acid biosynthesis glycosyltransferase
MEYRRSCSDAGTATHKFIPGSKGGIQILLKHKTPDSNLQSRGGRQHNASFFYPWLKRVLDIIFSVMVLILTFPLMVLIGIVIRMDSPGSAVFKHKRIGINRRNVLKLRNNKLERRKNNGFGRPFTLYKFRTMYADARDRFPDLYRYDYSEEQLYSLPMKVLLAEPGSGGNGNGNKMLGNDPRITPMGRWLRRTSLDELPNFISVIKGDMSIVGPRPDIPDNVPNYKLEHMEKFNIKPGVTGFAQVMGRGTLSFHQTNEHDVEYVKNVSFWLDIKIILKTIWVTVTGAGAY